MHKNGGNPLSPASRSASTGGYLYESPTDFHKSDGARVSGFGEGSRDAA